MKNDNMVYQLIILNNQPILISDEEVKSGDSVLFNISSTVVHKNVKVDNTSVYDEKGKLLFDKKGTIKIIAGIPELPKIDFSGLTEEDCKKIGWIDVDRLVENRIPESGYVSKEDTLLKRKYFKQGFKAAQSLNEKKFSIEEIFSILDLHTDAAPISYLKSELVKKLSQPKVFDVLIETENPLKETITIGVGSGSLDTIASFDKAEITNNSIKITKIL